MNTPTLLTVPRPIDPAPSRSASERLSERRRQYEAMLLRSYAGMRARDRAA